MTGVAALGRRPGAGRLESALDLALAMPGRWGVEPGPRLLGPPDGISALLLDAGPGEIWTHPGDAHILSYTIEGEPRHRQWYDGRQIQDGPRLDRSVTIVPAGVAPRAVLGVPIRVLHVYLPHADLARRAAEAGWPRGRGGALEIVDPRSTSDPHLEGLASLTVDALVAGDALHDRLYLDSLTGALAARVLQRWSNLGSAGLDRHTGGLAARHRRLVVEYLEANLCRDVRLAELCALTGLSETHLCRAFRQSTGLPPHAWLVARRLERAKEMLGATELSVLDVALACGFAHGQHLARAFRRATGSTPSEYRRNRWL